MAEVNNSPYAPDQCGQNTGQSDTAARLPLSETRAHEPLNREKDGEIGGKQQYKFCAGHPMDNKLAQLAKLEEENRTPPGEEGVAASVELKKHDGGSGFTLPGKERHIPVKQVPALKYRPPLVRKSDQVVDRKIPTHIDNSPLPKKTVKPSKTCKLLIVGHPKCGKSSIIRRFVQNNFEARYCTTIGADYMRKDMTASNGDCVRMQLWDIAGQERFAKLTRSYYRRAQGAIIVCDLTRPATIEAVEDWKKELEEHCGGIPTFLVGNKLDLLESDMPFSANEKLEKLGQDLGFDKWYSTSAKVGLNIEEALTDLLAHILVPNNSVDTVKSESVDNGAFKLSSFHPPNKGGKMANDNMPCCLG